MKHVLDCVVRIVIRLGQSSSLRTVDAAAMLVFTVDINQSHVNWVEY